MTKKEKQNQIIIYQDSKKDPRLEIRLEKETIWLTQAQISDLFATERSVITKHIRNIFSSNELDEKSNVQKMHIANSDKPVNLYDLDVVISVGYRVNSQKATQFRIWATKVLRKYLVDGYAVNENRLLEAKNNLRNLQNTIEFLKKKSKAKLLSGQEGEILSLLSDYSKTLTILEKYDKNNLKKSGSNKAVFHLEYKKCIPIIAGLKKELLRKKEAGDIFGMERKGSFEGIIGNIYQTFSQKELYKTLEEKASHLLYFIIKDHPFSDGNKRIGSFMFVYFLDKNNFLYKENGERKINDNALAALALLVAESNPKEKNQIIALITQLLK